MLGGALYCNKARTNAVLIGCFLGIYLGGIYEQLLRVKP